MAPGVLFHPRYYDHETGRHPEHAGRLAAVMELLETRGLLPRLHPLEAPPASREALEAVHSPEYLRLLQETCGRGGGFLTADTPFGPHSYEAAALGSGAAIRAVDGVLDGEVPQAFSLVRPPGHHACPDHGMGFCLLNHAAVAARHAVRERGLSRVLLVDFDVHHGNGTQDVFFEDPSVLFFSMHQYPAYPGTGALNELGRSEGLGTTVNVPLPPGTGDAGFLHALEDVLVPVAREYRPELILCSAGYDAHWTNTAYLNSIRMCATVSGFAAWVRLLRSLAEELCGGKLVLTLEGGYDPTALAWSVDATFRVLLDEPFEDRPGPAPGTVRADVQPIIEECRRIHGL